MSEYTHSPESCSPLEVLARGRERIDAIDQTLAELLVNRLAIAHALAAARRTLGQPVYNGEQHQRTMDIYAQETHSGRMDNELAAALAVPLLTADVLVQVSPEDMALYQQYTDTLPDLVTDGVEQLMAIDAQIAHLASDRLETALAIGAAKRDVGLPIYNGMREDEVSARFIQLTADGNVPEELARTIITRLITASRGLQQAQAVEDLDAELATLSLEVAGAR